MTKKLGLFAGLAVGAALSVSSCAYDPYYGGTSVGASYSTGSGYGGSSSVFVSTGDPRWGYDSYSNSYYDYNRRAYYDPYLYGYYPVGYRPPIIIGAPRPYGWREGRYCPPPRRVNHITIVNYRDRERNYRNSNYGWSRQVRQSQPGREGFRPPGGGSDRFDGRDRDLERQPGSGQFRRDDNRQTPSSGFRSRDDRNPSQGSAPRFRGDQDRIQPRQPGNRESTRPERGSSRYNSPIQAREQNRPQFQENPQRRGAGEKFREPQRTRSAPREVERAPYNNGRGRKEADDQPDRSRLRGLGEG